MKNNLVKSFTIIELLVALVLSSIMVVISLFVYFQFQKMVVDSIKRADNVNQTILFVSQFKEDFESAEIIKNKKKEIYIIKSYDERITYLFNDSTIVRNYNETEIIYKHKITELNIINNNDLVFVVDFNIRNRMFSKIHCYYYKEYTPESLICNKIY